jgi:hypothetical protein
LAAKDLALPARDDDFFARVEIDAVGAVDVEIAEE